MGRIIFRSAILPEISGINMIGGVFVEVSPSYDTSGATAIAGAHAVQSSMYLGFNSKNKRA